VINRPSSRPWTHEDNNELRTMAIAAATSHAIGAQLHRSEKAVRARALRLRIISKTKLFKTQPSRHEMTPSGPRWGYAALAQRCSDDVRSTYDLAPYKPETLTPFYNSDVLAGLPAVN
jgi:hypothetical protein